MTLDTFALALMLIGLTAITITANHTIERNIMTVQNQIDQIVAQLHKSYGELSTQLSQAVDNVQAQFAAVGVTDPDLDALKAIAQKLDDLVPDAAADIDEAAEGADVEVVDEPADVVDAELADDDELVEAEISDVDETD